MKSISLTKLVEVMNLRNMTPEIDMTDCKITIPEINRPALQLTGYFEHFANERIQIIGYVEYTYLQHLDMETRRAAYEAFVSKEIPCVIFTTLTQPGEELLELAKKYSVPTFCTDKSTSAFTAEIIRWMNVQLAPTI